MVSKRSNFPPENCRDLKAERSENNADMDQDREMLKVYNLQLRTSGLGEIFSDLLDKIFCLQYTYLFSEHFWQIGFNYVF